MGGRTVEGFGAGGPEGVGGGGTDGGGTEGLSNNGGRNLAPFYVISYLALLINI